MRNVVLVGTVLEKLKEIPDDHVQCMVTSPPYWGLRDYGTAKWEGGKADCNHQVGRFEYPASNKQKSNSGSAGHQARNVCPKCGAVRIDDQLGLEPTPEEYIEKMVLIFREIRRCLRPDGTAWLNLGDSYAGSMKGSDGKGGFSVKSKVQKGNKGSFVQPSPMPSGLKSKDLVGIPWRVAFALQQDGWYLRSDIIWHKPNPMPESVLDRPTKAHEYIFLLSKSQRYYYDREAIREDIKPGADGKMSAPKLGPDRPKEGARNQNVKQYEIIKGANRRDVWTITTKPYKGAHFATFPPTIPERCIKAGSSEKGQCANCGAPYKRITIREKVGDNLGKVKDNPRAGIRGSGLSRPTDYIAKAHGEKWEPSCKCEYAMLTEPQIVLDPFAGSGTTLEVAQKLGRDWIGVELNPEYVETLISPRLQQTTLL